MQCFMGVSTKGAPQVQQVGLVSRDGTPPLIKKGTEWWWLGGFLNPVNLDLRRVNLNRCEVTSIKWVEGLLGLI